MFYIILKDPAEVGQRRGRGMQDWIDSVTYH